MTFSLSPFPIMPSFPSWNSFCSQETHPPTPASLASLLSSLMPLSHSLVLTGQKPNLGSTPVYQPHTCTQAAQWSWRKTHRPPDQSHLKFMMSFRCHPENLLPVNIPISPVHSFPTLSKDFSLFNFCFLILTHSHRSCLLSHWKNWGNWKDGLGSPDIPPPTCPLSFFLLLQYKELRIFLFKAFPATPVLDSVPSHLF